MATILVADDHPQIASILEEYLKKEGHRPVIARDGEEALALFRTAAPDAVLLDVMMPKLDGFAVCREIRKTSAVPVILITARGEDFEKIMGLDIGADDYIVKPFSPAEVMARVRSVLRRIGKTSLGEVAVVRSREGPQVEHRLAVPLQILEKTAHFAPLAEDCGAVAGRSDAEESRLRVDRVEATVSSRTQPGNVVTDRLDCPAGNRGLQHRQVGLATRRRERRGEVVRLSSVAVGEL